AIWMVIYPNIMVEWYPNVLVVSTVWPVKNIEPFRNSISGEKSSIAVVKPSTSEKSSLNKLIFMPSDSSSNTTMEPSSKANILLIQPSDEYLTPSTICP
ncbi:MAG: hypothetical protein B7X54_08860, partial [Idiomarina sp. 34-48-12]